jgi:hypothetical protein
MFPVNTEEFQLSDSICAWLASEDLRVNQCYILAWRLAGAGASSPLSLLFDLFKYTLEENC